MSTYGDAFAITPQRSLPREKAAEMLEHIFQLNEEYEERKEIEDNPAYRQLLERRRSVEKKYVGDVQARGRAMEKVLAAGAPGELPGEVMAEERVGACELRAVAGLLCPDGYCRGHDHRHTGCAAVRHDRRVQLPCYRRADHARRRQNCAEAEAGADPLGPAV